METKMETRQDRLAIMRWEDETGPTTEKNKHPGKGTLARTAAKSATATGKRSVIQGKLQKIPIVSIAGPLKQPRHPPKST